MTGVHADDGRDNGHDNGHDSRYCNGQKRQGEGRCTRPAGWGTDHPGIGYCKLHGGNTESHKRAAQLEQARRDVALFGARLDIDAKSALIELVQWTAGEVEYWRRRVNQLDEADLTWGVTKVKDGGDDRGTTKEAKPHIAYTLLIDASNRLERYASAALKAGVDERLVRVAEAQGAALAGVLTRVLDAMLAAIVAVLGPYPAAAVVVEGAWHAAVVEVVPRELQALAEPEPGDQGGGQVGGAA